MLDRDIAELYGVETRRLNEQVHRNIERFPEDFCFQLNESELVNWKSQFATSNSEKMGLRKKPFVFTEQGVSMLSSVIKSKTAVKVSLNIIRAFVQMRHFLQENASIFQKPKEIRISWAQKIIFSSVPTNRLKNSKFMIRISIKFSTLLSKNN